MTFNEVLVLRYFTTLRRYIIEIKVFDILQYMMEKQMMTLYYKTVVFRYIKFSSWAIRVSAMWSRGQRNSNEGMVVGESLWKQREFLGEYSSWPPVEGESLVWSMECGGFVTGCERLHLVSLIQDASELAVLWLVGRSHKAVAFALICRKERRERCLFIVSEWMLEAGRERESGRIVCRLRMFDEVISGVDHQEIYATF